MRRIGFALIDPVALTVVKRFEDTTVDSNGRPMMMFVIPGTTDEIHSPLIGATYGGLKFVERFTDEVPVYDVTKQVVSAPTEVVQADKVIFGNYVLRNLTQTELDNLDDGLVMAPGLVLFEALFNHENRIRVLEGKAPITRTQLKTALRALLTQIRTFLAGGGTI